MATVTITETEPLVVKVHGAPFVRRTAIFYPDRVEYQGISHAFDHIEHVWWASTRTIINYGMQTSLEQELRLFVKGENDPVVLKQEDNRYFRTQFEMTLGTAWEFVAARTFRARIASYVNSLDSRGCFTYEGCEICHNGDVRYKGTAYSLRDLDYSGFVLMKRERGVFDVKPGIALNMDIDVVRALLAKLAV